MELDTKKSPNLLRTIGGPSVDARAPNRYSRRDYLDFIASSNERFLIFRGHAVNVPVRQGPCIYFFVFLWVCACVRKVLTEDFQFRIYLCQNVVQNTLAEKGTELTAEQEQRRKIDDRSQEVDNGAREEEA